MDALHPGFIQHFIVRQVVAKGLHLICANDVTEAGSGFGTDTNRVTILGRDGSREDLPLLSKAEVAERLLDRVEGLLPGSGQVAPAAGAGEGRRSSPDAAPVPAR